jgi:hypothetical protein
MEMRIMVPDSGSASALALRLASVFGGDRVTLTDDRHEVDLDIERGSDRTILRVLDAVERWLDGAAVTPRNCGLGSTHTRWPGARRSRPDFDQARTASI